MFCVIGMAILGHGIDLVECERVAAMLERHGEHFLERVLTAAERRRAGQFKFPVQHVAGRFAAKEAILKMLGTGWRGGIAWTDMDISNDAAGAPVVALADETARLAAARGITRVILSITHTKRFAAASAIGVDE